MIKTSLYPPPITCGLGKSIKTGTYVFTQDGHRIEEVFQGRVSWRPPRGEGMGTWLFVEEFQQAYLRGLKQESISGGRNSKNNGTEVERADETGDWMEISP